jgi:O-methyltransferase
MVKDAVRRLMPVSVYLRRHPLEPQLTGGRLDEYLAAVAERGHVEGAVLEVGCFRGATTVAACRAMKQAGVRKRYVCVDTFAGFVADQFESDVAHGTPETFRSGFAENPREMFDRTMRHLELDVESIEADICELDPAGLPPLIAACLMDVDLAVPIHDGLEKVYPRLARGGIVLVDDCDEGTEWRGARSGYQDFVRAHGLAERYTPAGLGIVEK